MLHSSMRVVDVESFHRELVAVAKHAGLLPGMPLPAESGNHVSFQLQKLTEVKAMAVGVEMKVEGEVGGGRQQIFCTAARWCLN